MTLTLLALAALLEPPSVPACDSVPACIAEARRVARPGEGIDEAEQAVAARLEALAPESIDAVIELLEDPDPEVRALAGYTVRGMEGLEARHFEPLRKAVLDGNGWVPIALASIGTPEALDFLMATLRAEPERETQVTGALARFGAAAVPGLVDLFRCRADCDADLLLAAGGVLWDMGEPAREAAAPLANIAADVSMPVANRVRVMHVLAGLGTEARPAVPGLLPLSRSEDLEIRKAARQAILKIGGESTEEVLAALLEEPGSRVQALRDIASHGATAAPVGRHVEALLVSPDREERVVAARTLGFIAYGEAGPALAEALQDDADWRLVYAAAESLGRLRAKEARGALEATAQGHWYPPVRQSARGAIRRLDGVEPVPTINGGDFRLEFEKLEYVPDTHGACDALPSSPVVPRRVRRFRQEEDATVARSLSYPIVSHGRRSPQVPNVGVHLPGGWLLGSDNGEWGGELVFRPDRGPIQLIREGNVRDIQLIGRSTLVAIGGLAHLGMDEGAVYRIEHDAARGWRAVWWRELPGAPRKSWPIAGNQLLVVATGGSIVLSPDGTMALAPCHTDRRE